MIITDFDDDRLLKSGYINEASHDFSWDLILEYITKAGIEIEDITVKRNFSFTVNSYEFLMNLTFLNYTYENFCCGIKFFAFWQFSKFLLQVFA